MADFLGGILGGIGSLVGSYFNNQAQSKREEQAFQRQFDAQNFFNTHQIQQRVEDAKAAGIHPIYAMGGPTTSAPSYQVGQRESIGAGLSEMGQGIGRAATALLDPDTKKANQLTLEGMSLDNDMKRQQLQANAGSAANQTKGVPTTSKKDELADHPDLKEQNTNEPQHTRGGVTGDIPVAYGFRIKRGKGVDAQTGEDVWGPLGEILVGTGNLVESGHLTINDALSRIRSKATRLGADVREHIIRKYLEARKKPSTHGF